MQFFIALIPPFLYSIGNILDKQLVYRGGSHSPAIIVALSSLLGIVVAPLIFIFGDIKILPIADIAVMFVSGALTAWSVFLYLKALENNSVYSVAPALQLGPVFSYFFGIFVFEEFLSMPKIIGCLIIIVCATLLNLKIDSNAMSDKKFRIKTFVIIALSSLALATSGTLFKFFAVEYNYWTVQFYEYIGLCIVGIAILILSPVIKKRIVQLISFRKKFRSFTILNIITEIIMVLGDLTLNYSTLLLPIAIAFSFNALQPLFLIVLGLFIFKISPKTKLDIDIKDNVYNKKTAYYTVLISLGAILVAA